jgi:lipid-binding SYLF domain-containing protein
MGRDLCIAGDLQHAGHAQCTFNKIRAYRIRGTLKAGRSLQMRTLLVGVLCLAPLLAKDEEPVKRLEEAAAVFSEIMGTPDKGIPQDLLEKAHCIVIVPGLKKGAFIVGGKYGKGYLSCRKTRGAGWSAPGTVRIALI